MIVYGIMVVIAQIVEYQSISGTLLGQCLLTTRLSITRATTAAADMQTSPEQSHHLYNHHVQLVVVRASQPAARKDAPGPSVTQRFSHSHARAHAHASPRPCTPARRTTFFHVAEKNVRIRRLFRETPCACPRPRRTGTLI